MRDMRNRNTLARKAIRLTGEGVVFLCGANVWGLTYDTMIQNQLLANPHLTEFEIPAKFFSYVVAYAIFRFWFIFRKLPGD